MTITRALLIGLGVGAIVVGSACGGDDEASGDTTVPATDESAPGEPAALAPSTLNGREFVSVDVAGIELVQGSTIRLSFDGNKIGVSPGCNQFGGTFRLDDGKLVVADGMAGTEMACEQPLMRQDTAVTDFLMANPEISLEGDELTLTGPDATITLRDREVVEPDRSLGGPTWTLDTLLDGETASGGFAVKSTLRVDRKQNRLLVEAGCNTGSADVEIRDGEMVIGDLLLTRMACKPDIMDVENHVVSVLSGKTVTFEIEADRLTIHAGKTGLGYQAAG